MSWISAAQRSRPASAVDRSSSRESRSQNSRTRSLCPRVLRSWRPSAVTSDEHRRRRLALGQVRAGEQRRDLPHAGRAPGNLEPARRPVREEHRHPQQHDQRHQPDGQPRDQQGDGDGRSHRDQDGRDPGQHARPDGARRHGRTSVPTAIGAPYASSRTPADSRGRERQLTSVRTDCVVMTPPPWAAPSASSTIGADWVDPDTLRDVTDPNGGYVRARTTRRAGAACVSGRRGHRPAAAATLIEEEQRDPHCRPAGGSAGPAGRRPTPERPLGGGPRSARRPHGCRRAAGTR